MSQSDFFLIVDRILIVGPEACVEDPLLKPEVASGKLLRNRVALGQPRVAGQVRKADDDAARPMFHNLSDLLSESLSNELEVAFVLVAESSRGFQLFPIPDQNRRSIRFIRSLAVSSNDFGNHSHKTSLAVCLRSAPAEAALGSGPRTLPPPSYSAALAANVSTTARFATRSSGKPCLSFKYSGLL
jgi:hypothetical protein